MKPIGIAALLLACSACSMMPDVKVDGVDNLRTTEHEMNALEVAATCGSKMGMGPLWLLAPPLACATIVLETWTCDIYYSALFKDISIDHERLHCKGYWHDGQLQAYYDNWKAQNAPR